MEAEIPISFLVLIVLYETAPSASQTISSLLKNRSLQLCDRIVVLDHSSADQAAACSAICDAGQPLVYSSDPSNPPLGFAYNRAIRSHLEDSRYVIILDQDTCLPENFLETASTIAVSESEPSSMTPNMISCGRVASPCWSLYGWGRSWRKSHSGWHSWRICSAITSASCIHRRVFIDYGLRYNETLILYGIDTDFFRSLGMRDSRFYVLPLSIEHSLSFDEASLSAKADKLDKIFQANRSIYSDAAWPSRMIVRALEILLRVKYCLRYWNTMFLMERDSEQRVQKHPD